MYINCFFNLKKISSMCYFDPPIDKCRKSYVVFYTTHRRDVEHLNENHRDCEKRIITTCC